LAVCRSSHGFYGSDRYAFVGSRLARYSDGHLGNEPENHLEAFSVDLVKIVGRSVVVFVSVRKKVEDRNPLAVERRVVRRTETIGGCGDLQGLVERLVGTAQDVRPLLGGTDTHHG
jgi:hypothetical protein